jgi:site-specific DNA-methyltransferase (adenine-specific)
MLGMTKRWVIMTCDHRHAALTLDWKEHVRLGVWVKDNPMPQLTGDRPGSGYESVLMLHNAGKKRWNGGGKAAVWQAASERDPRVVTQPTQKPLNLVLRFVTDFTDHGDTVCDPFMGSGTTGIACIRTGRKFIGIEKDEERFKAACKRIRYELAQGVLFSPRESAEQAKELF